MIKTLAQKWPLTDLQPVTNMTYHYVAKATRQDMSKVVLKFGYDNKTYNEERSALDFFNGNGMVKLIDTDDSLHALLLEQVVPGTTLSTVVKKDITASIQNYASVFHQLMNNTLPQQHSFKHIGDWLTAIDKVSSNTIPKSLLQQAINIKNELLKTSPEKKVLHGDLHLDNILQSDQAWTAIDPKGVIGDPAFEVFAIEFLTPEELELPNIKSIFKQRVQQLADALQVSPKRLEQWTLVRLILSAAWFIEDNSYPEKVINLALKLW